MLWGNFFIVYLFILREKERERMSGEGAERERERERERGRERIPSRLHTVSTEPNVGLRAGSHKDLRNGEIMT